MSVAKGKGKKHPGGRPPRYKWELNDLSYKYCLLGATDADLAMLLGTSERTINNWKIKHPEFFQSIKEGRVVADANVGHKLYQRATGYSHPDVDIRVVDHAIVKTNLIKHYPPDPVSMIFWLKNRKPEKWRDKIDTSVGLDAATVELILSALPPDYAAAVRAKLLEMKEK